ncbi:MAG: hypothetical protein PVJ57_06225 [Phycisphaerae bacterium]|jgi:hypothetical protein
MPNVYSLRGLLDAENRMIRHWARAALAWTQSKRLALLTTASFAATFASHDPWVARLPDVSDDLRRKGRHGWYMRYQQDLSEVAEQTLRRRLVREVPPDEDISVMEPALKRAWALHCARYREPDLVDYPVEAFNFHLTLVRDVHGEFTQILTDAIPGIDVELRQAAAMKWATPDLIIELARSASPDELVWWRRPANANTTLADEGEPPLP